MKKFALYFGPLLGYVIIIAVVLFVGGITEVSLALLSNLVAVGGLIVAFSATMISHWTRLDPQRQALYKAQMAAYTEVYTLALRTNSEILELIHHEHLEAKVTRSDELMSQFIETSRKYWVIYPKEVRDRILAFDAALSNFVRAVKERPDDDEFLMDVLMTSENLGPLLDGFRSSLGIDRLHEDTLRLLGVSESSRSQQK